MTAERNSPHGNAALLAQRTNDFPGYLIIKQIICVSVCSLRDRSKVSDVLQRRFGINSKFILKS